MFPPPPEEPSQQYQLLVRTNFSGSVKKAFSTFTALLGQFFWPLHKLQEDGGVIAVVQYPILFGVQVCLPSNVVP